MTSQDQPDVGGRIRELREQRGLSLRALADRCGLSINAISRIERGENSPTVTSLHRLATALNVPITNLFRSGAELSTIIIRRNRRPRSRGEGILIESLGVGLPNQRIEPFLMTLAPGSSAGEEPISHGGEEFVFCIDGEVEYLVDQEWLRLEAGDSLIFRATQLHLCRNTGIEKASVLFVIQAMEEDFRVSRQQHMMMVENLHPN
jgi:transcriptional regulator with XRE-family HTH domain